MTDTETKLHTFVLYTLVLHTLASHSFSTRHLSTSLLSLQHSLLSHTRLPSSLYFLSNMSKQFNSGLFGCFDDIGICLTTCICPCVQYGLNQDRLHAGDFCSSCLLYGCCPACACCFHTPRRAELRRRDNLAEEPCSDCLVVCCCPCCAIIQEGIQLQNSPPPQQQNMY